jgi:hypothetical protein
MAIYPGAGASDSNLYIAVNATSTQLTDNPLSNSATTVNVTDATAFPTVGFISIDNEIISYTGKTGTSFTGCGRGADGTTAASHVQNSQVFHNVIAAHHNAPKDEIIAVEADLVSAFGALTPSGPNSTDTSVANRVKSILQQLKAIAGITNWYDAITVSLINKLSLSGGTMSGNIAMGSNKVTGLAAASANGDAVRYEQLNVGKILQIVTASTNTQATSTSSSFADTNLTATITPTSNTSKIHVLVSQSISVTGSANSVDGRLRLLRGSTNITPGTSDYRPIGINDPGAYEDDQQFAADVIDSPATTSATTYKTQFARGAGGGTLLVQRTNNATNGVSTITLIEIGQ